MGKKRVREISTGEKGQGNKVRGKRSGRKEREIRSGGKGHGEESQVKWPWKIRSLGNKVREIRSLGNKGKEKRSQGRKSAETAMENKVIG